MTFYKLKDMYDAWSCGNEAHRENWLDFVEMSAKECGTTADEVMRYLQTCRWFKKGYDYER